VSPEPSSQASTAVERKVSTTAEQHATAALYVSDLHWVLPPNKGWFNDSGLVTKNCGVGQTKSEPHKISKTLPSPNTK